MNKFDINKSSANKYIINKSILMMYFSHLLMILSLFLMSTVFSVEASQKSVLIPALQNPGYAEKPAWFKKSFLNLFDDIDEATEDNKRLLLYFYQDGCPYCKKLLQDNFGQHDIAKKTQKYFDVVAINIWGDREVQVGNNSYPEKKFAEALKIQYTPTLLFFNKKHKVVFRANGYYPPEKFKVVLDYIGQHKEQQMSFQDYLKKVSPEPASGKLHTEISTVKSLKNLQQAVSKKKYLLVMFEQKQCSSCDELHEDILKRKVSRDLLKKFNIAVVDMWSNQIVITPDGHKMRIRDWAKKLNITYAPSMLYFNAKGKEVFRSDAYLKAFHIQSVMDYISSNSYKTQPDFQRYINTRAEHLRQQGIKINLMK